MAMKKSRTISQPKSTNELRHPANKPGGTGYGGGGGSSKGKAPGEMVSPSNRPGGTGYGGKK